MKYVRATEHNLKPGLWLCTAQQLYGTQISKIVEYVWLGDNNKKNKVLTDIYFYTDGDDESWQPERFNNITEGGAENWYELQLNTDEVIGDDKDMIDFIFTDFIKRIN